MPGKSSVVVRFIGDTTGLDAAMGKSESRLGRMGGVFQSIGQKIGGEFGDLLSTVGESFDKLGEKGGKNLGTNLAVGGGAVTALGVAMQQMGSANKQATDQLNAAIASTGKPLDKYKEQIESTIKAQENLGHSDDDTQTALRRLTQATNDPAVALKNMGLVANLAAAQHISLADAATQVAKIMAGKGARTLAQYGVQTAAVGNLTTKVTSAQKQHAKAVDELAKANAALSLKQEQLSHKTKITAADEQALTAAHDKVRLSQQHVTATTQDLTVAQKNLANPLSVTQGSLDQLSRKLDGQAAASVDNFAGKVGILRTKLGDWAADTATKVGPALTAIGPVLMVVGALVQAGTFSWIKNAAAATVSGTATLVTATATKVAAAGQWLLNAALSANPIGIVIIALIALVAGIIYAYKHFATFRHMVDAVGRAFLRFVRWVVDGITRVVGWVRSHWQLLLALLTGPVGLAALYIHNHLGQITGFFTSLPGRIRSAFSGLVNIITSPFSAAFGKVSSMIGSITGALSSIVPKGFSLPHIPGFAGGTSFAPGGLAMVGERGPELVELPRGSKVHPSGSGPVGGGIHVHVGQIVASADTAHSFARALVQHLDDRQYALGGV